MKQMTFKKCKAGMLILMIFTATLFLTGCWGNNSSDNGDDGNLSDKKMNIVRQQTTYMAGNDTMVGYLFYDENSNEEKPGIIVVHEWWGNNSYPQKRAEMLAELGYTVLAADMYGNGLTVTTPEEAQANAEKVYHNPELLKVRMLAAHQELARSDRADEDKIAAVGYCFGGTVGLAAANMAVPVKPVISFHGGLQGFTPSPAIGSTPILICNGEADKFIPVEDKERFKKQMDSIGANYSFKEYKDAAHAFTNWHATQTGRMLDMPIAYNEEADKQSWEDMKEFLNENFPPHSD
jgi:dienelactone hydrolase